jgi:hypothetical protein
VRGPQPARDVPFPCALVPGGSLTLRVPAEHPLWAHEIWNAGVCAALIYVCALFISTVDQPSRAIACPVRFLWLAPA